MVKIPDPSKPFILTTDASNYAVGAELRQVENGEEHPVLWFSKALTSSQVNYSTYERELLAVVLACEHFCIYLLGKEFLLRTDHRALMGIFTSKMANSSRIAKWLLILHPVKFQIDVIKGKDNIVADALSRIPWPITVIDNVTLPNGRENLFSFDSENFSMIMNEPELPLFDLKEIAGEQSIDSDLVIIRDWVITNHVPTLDDSIQATPHLRAYLQLLENISVGEREGLEILYWKECAGRERILIPRSMVQRLLTQAHEKFPMAHEGYRKLSNRLFPYYYWPGMRSDIKLFIESCPVCD